MVEYPDFLIKLKVILPNIQLYFFLFIVIFKTSIEYQVSVFNGDVLIALVVPFLIHVDECLLMHQFWILVLVFEDFEDENHGFLFHFERVQ